MARRAIPDQPSLFEDPAPAAPQGFAYRPELVAPAEEIALAGEIARLDLRAYQHRGYEALRRVAYFGWRYDGAELIEADPIPAFLEPLRLRAAEFAGLAPERLQHALINEYRPGAPIGWHRDRPAFGDVVGVSLLSPCMLRLRRRQGESWDRLSSPLAPRSAYLLRGPARQVWEHSIGPAEVLRYSITFRTLRPR